MPICWALLEGHALILKDSICSSGARFFSFFFHVRKLAAPQRQHLREIFIVVFTESTLGLCVCYLNSNSSAVCWPNIVSVMHSVTVFARRLR